MSKGLLIGFNSARRIWTGKKLVWVYGDIKFIFKRNFLPFLRVASNLLKIAYQAVYRLFSFALHQFLVCAYELKRSEASQKSCFKSAENRTTNSLWVGDHRYTSISYTSNLIQVQSDLKLQNLDFEVPNQLKIGQRVAYGQAIIGTWKFCACQICCGFRAI